jgi:rare lipoprotein A
MLLRNVKTLSSLMGLPLLLAGCAGGEAEAPVRTPAPAQVQVPEGVSDTPVVVGAPYTINGRSYTPVDASDYDEVGYASWYGSELHGRPTANGEAFRADAITAAHRTLPLPSYVEVTRLDTGRTILVRINDRGPADPNRVIDLSAGAAEQLGIAELGMTAVRVRRVNPTQSERMILRRGERALDRLTTPDSLLEILRERANRLPRPEGMSSRPPSVPISVGTPAAPVTTRPAPTTPAPTRPTAPAAPPSAANPAPRPAAAPAPAPATNGRFIVQAGAFSSQARASALATRLGARVDSVGGVHRVRLGPFATEREAQAAVARARQQGQPGAIIQRAP